MKFFNILLLASFVITGLFTACSPQTETTTAKGETLREKIEKDQRALEIYQIFALTELNRNLAFAKKQSEFVNASFIDVIEEFDVMIPVQQNIELAKLRLTEYLNSDNFKIDAINLSLADDFKTNALASLQAAQTSSTQLKAISEAITRITNHKDNAQTNVYENSLTQRLNDLNGDTIELKQNTAYLFPTEFFLNDQLLQTKDNIEELAPTFIKASESIGNIEKSQLNIPVRNNKILTINVNIDLYIKTI